MTSDIEPVRQASVRGNWGRWVAECSTSWCTNAWMPQLYEPGWRCGVCGLDTEIVWPPDPIAIEALLLMRVDPKTRNWEPGETLADLLAENIENGMVPDDLAALTSADQVDVMTVIDGRVVGGLVYGPIEAWRTVRTEQGATAFDAPWAQLALTAAEGN